MDILIDLIKELWQTLNLREFMVAIGAMGVGSIYFGKIIGRAKKRDISIVAALTDKSDEELAIEGLTAQVKALSDTWEALSKTVSDLETQSASQRQVLETAHQHILNAIGDRRRDDKSADERILSNLRGLEELINQTRVSFDRLIENLRQQLTIHDVQELQMFDNQRSIITTTLDTINRIQQNVEKIDEYVRSAIPEFKTAHRELSKELSVLSRDVALVERAITHYGNTANLSLRN